MKYIIYRKKKDPLNLTEAEGQIVKELFDDPKVPNDSIISLKNNSFKKGDIEEIEIVTFQEIEPEPEPTEEEIQKGLSVKDDIRKMIDSWRT